MGGVRGRSQGCKTCLERKVKCDEAQPHCTRCVQSGLLCAGYSKELKFIDATPKQVRQRFAQGFPNNPHASADGRHSPIDSNGLLMQSGRLDATLPSSRQPSLSPFQTEICTSYLVQAIFCSDEGFSLSPQLRDSAAGINSTTKLSQFAVQSLATAYFGRMHGNHQSLVSQGRSLYGQAVRQLAMEIQKPTVCCHQDVVLAAVALYFFEIIMNTTELGWVQHAGGIARLIEIRGPESHQLQPVHDYFLFCRRILLAQAMVTRKRTCLERKEWKTVPWAKYPGTKTPEHYLLDIQANIPGIAEDLDRLDGNGCFPASEQLDSNAEAELRLLVKGRLINLMRDLIRWRYSWEQSNQEVVSETDVAPTNNITAHLKRPAYLNSTYYYNNIELADEIHIYNVCLMWELHFVRRFKDPSVVSTAFDFLPQNSRPQPSNPLLLPHEGVGIMDVAREIMRSIKYCLLPHHPKREQLKITAPLRCCILAFRMLGESHEHELQWASGTLSRIADGLGFELCRRMIELPPIGYREPERGQTVERGSGAYAFIDPSIGVKHTFLPLTHSNSSLA